MKLRKYVEIMDPLFSRTIQKTRQQIENSPADPELDSDSLEFFPLKKDSSDAEIICD